jgi:hypothetical protein
MIDHAIGAALRERKPAYIEIACNLSDAPCPEPGPCEAIMAPEQSNPRALAAAVARAAALLAGANKPILLAGAHLRFSGAIGAFRDAAEALGCAVAVMPDAKGLFPEDHPQYIGICWGPVSSPGCEAVMDWADVILAAGPVFSDYTTAGWTGEPPAGKMINVSARDVRFPGAEYTSVAMADFLAALAKNVHGNDATLTQFHRIAAVPAEPAARNGDPSAQLTRAELWHQIEQDLDPESTLLCERGDSWFNGAFTRLPGGARFEIEMQWGSLGWACPASFGYAMGLEPGRRLVSVIGGRLLPADRPGSGQHDPPRPADRHLPGQQPRARLRIGDPRRPVQLLQELGLRRPDRRLERRGRPRAGPDRGHRQRTGRRDQHSTPAQRRPGVDRMPDRARRLQPPAHRMGRTSRPRQHPPAPDHLIHKVIPVLRTQRGGSQLADCNRTGHNTPSPAPVREAAGR